MSDAKRLARDWVDGHAAELSRWHATIWDYAEPAWREYRSADWYVRRLRDAGFSVEEGSGGMPTAFSATWSNGPGPVILAYAEYDAVPGQCQAAATRQRPRPGLSRFAPGHTDPHSALGIGTLGAVLAAQAAMTASGITGTLRYMGEPAEKVQGSKVVHGLRGYYDGVDAIISFHPFYMLPLCNTVAWDTHCGAYYSRIYTFLCEHPETWNTGPGAPAGGGDPAGGAGSPIPAAHAAPVAPGADVALTTLAMLARSCQPGMAAAHGGWSLTSAVLTAGQATADNLPASLAQVQYSWRCPTVGVAEAVLRTLDNAAAAAAAASHCELRTRWVARNRPGVANHAMAEITWQNLAETGPPRYGADAVAAAQAIQESLSMTPAAEPFLPQTEQLIDPREAERLLREQLPPSQRNFTSDDYVEMTWYAPTARLYIARPALAGPGPDGGGYPAWVMNALGGIAAAIDPTILVAAKTISGTVLDLLTRPDVLTAARTEFAGRTGGQGRIEPLLPADFTAPVTFRWPEYVQTPRGREWWIPDSADF